MSPRILVVADDLMWSTRLTEAVKRAGGATMLARSQSELMGSLTAAMGFRAVIVDLNGKTYDGVEAVRNAAGKGHRVLAVGQHEDLDLRKAALAAGAKRVFSYNKLFTDGTTVVADLIEGRL
jgi:DNA-binding response OmpR family regulator